LGRETLRVVLVLHLRVLLGVIREEGLLYIGSTLLVIVRGALYDNLRGDLRLRRSHRHDIPMQKGQR
jgi:hypothetical protein